MKNITILFGFLFTSSLCFAQYENFDLAKYKLPDIKRHQMDLELGANGNSYYGRLNFENSDASISDYYNANGNSSLGYSFFKNTEKVQGNLLVDLSTNFDVDKQEYNESVVTDEYQLYNTLIGSYEAKYFLRKEWFYLLDPYLYSSFNKQEDKVGKSDFKSKTFNPSLGGGFGKGRIEQVQDYRQAILIIKELEKRGVLNRTLTENEMIEFAQEISTVKNERFFDSRKRKEKELMTIDSFLKEKGLIRENDINYFVGTDDMWTYGALQIRESGTEWRVVFTPGYHYTDREGGERLYDAFNTGYKFEYKYRKPINIKWQFESDFELNHYYHKLLRQENISPVESKYRSNILFYNQVGYYPNTRTYITAYFSVVLENRSDEKFLDEDGYNEQIGLGTNAYYYLSEKLRFELALSYYWHNNTTYGRNVTDSLNKSFNYNLKLNYAIF
uniref:hypothetical protein n=1 Tax=uncultured Draconibacterium sp. TaxID=1573823 RepID=UPI0032171831